MSKRKKMPSFYFFILFFYFIAWPKKTWKKNQRKKGVQPQRKEEGLYDPNNPILPFKKTLKKMNVCYKQKAREQKKGVSSFPFKPVKPEYNKTEEDRWQPKSSLQRVVKNKENWPPTSIKNHCPFCSALIPSFSSFIDFIIWGCKLINFGRWFAL